MSVFPPSGPSGVTKTIPSYLYQEYNDDDDLQAFVLAFNTISQQYIDWANAIQLPVYTGATIAGPLLDWVAQGLYGISRPTLSSGTIQYIGLFDSAEFNRIMFGQVTTIGSIITYTTSDDFFKRIITWHFYKGDGKNFSIGWLKRRIARFLRGINGANIGAADTSAISISMVNDNVTITITVNSIDVATMAAAKFLQAAIASQVVELPFQYGFAVLIAIAGTTMTFIPSGPPRWLQVVQSSWELGYAQTNQRNSRFPR